MASPDSISYTFASPRRQHWTVPRDLMRYVTINWSPKAYQKLIQTCKYFFALDRSVVIYYANKMLLTPNEIRDLQYWAADIEEGRIFTIAKNRHHVDLKVKKVWMTGDLYWNHYPRASISILIKNVARFDLTSLYLVWQNLSQRELSKIVDSTYLKNVKLVDTTIFLAEKRMATVVDILALMPKVSNFYYSSSSQKAITFPSSSIADLPHMPKLKSFRLEFIHDDFDYSSFIRFIKKHPKSEFKLFLVSSLEFDKTFKHFITQKFKNSKVRTEKQHHYPTWVLSNKDLEIRIQSIIH